MKILNPEYQEALEAIVKELQASEEFTKFQEDEEEEDYHALREKFEPPVAALYSKVANENPLQLLAFEELLINSSIEGMFMARVIRL